MDSQSFEALYTRWERALFNTIYHRIQHRQEALDLVQEAYLKLWDRRESIHVEQAKAYLFQTALNLTSNRLRARKLWHWVGLDGLLSSREGGEEKLELDQRERQVRAAVAGLPDKIRTVLVLIRFAEMSYGEIASLLRIPEGTVGSRYNKGMRLLRTRLEGRDHEFE